MAYRSNRMSNKTIIAIVTAIVLLFVASISVGIFLADKGSAEAVEENQISEETKIAEENKPSDNTTSEQNSTENQIVENQTEENNQNAEANTSENNNQVVENNNQAEENNTSENAAEPNKNVVINNSDNSGNNSNETTSSRTENATANSVTNNNATTGNQERNNSNTEITTDTNVDEVGETTITRVEEQEKLVSKDFWNWWTPSSVIATNSAIADRIIPQTPDFTIEKIAETGVGENKLVYAGKDITYTIKVTNNSDNELKNIEITDKIPEQTTFVSIGDNQNRTIIQENDIVVGVKWIITVPAKETVEVKFTVKVNEEATGTISNVAIVNGEESNEEKTSIIKAEKSSEIIERENAKLAKLGDKIKYTIKVTNTGDISGKTTIEDIVPEGTELIEESVSDNGNISNTTDNRKQVSWEVEVNPNSTIERTFIVEVKDISGKIKNTATVGNEPTNPDERGTANIKVEKTVADIKRDKESIGKDAKVQAGDVIEYKIKVTNTGSSDLISVVLEEKLEGIEINPNDLKIGDLKAGESKEILATYTVRYEKDIQGNVGKLIHNEAVATGETTGETPEKVTDKDEKDVPVEEVKSLTINKTATKIKIKDSDDFVDVKDIKVRPGDVVEYTIVVTNTGNTTLENITVTDSLKVTVNGEEKDIDSNTGLSTIAVIPSLSAVNGENTTTIITYYTVTEADVVDANPIKNVAKATVPDGPSDDSKEEVPVNPDTSVAVKKIWDDKDNQDGVRPGEITINLLADNEKIQTVTISGTEHTFEKLPTYNSDGSKIVYTVSEENVTGYKMVSLTGTAENGYVITNKHTVEKTSVTVVKTWEDSENQDGIRPDEITVKLMNGTTEVTTAVLSEENNWTYTFKDLDKKANGTDINYTVAEVNVSGYESTVSGDMTNGFKITNKHTPEITSVKVNKIWDDAGNQDGKRPTKVTVTLKGNGKTIQSIDLNNDNNWTHIFDNLPKKSNGTDIEYTVEENDIGNGYTANISAKANATNEYDITNSYTPEKISISVSKAWEDGGNQDGKRPGSVNVDLYADGQKVVGRTTTLNEANQWNATLSDLPKYQNGEEIEYSFKEQEVNGYQPSITGSVEDGFVINNIHTPETVDITVSKKWENINNDAARNEYLISSIILQVKNGDKVVAEKTVTADDDWKYKFTGLPKYDAGNLINYTVAEVAVNQDDKTKLDKYYDANVNQETKVITNTFDPSNLPDTKPVILIKIWDDSSNKYNTRPTGVEFTVNGTNYQLTAKNDENVQEDSTDIWTKTINLPKYDSDGKEINYKATENTVPSGYTKISEVGTTVINRANEIAEKKAYKADGNGNVGSEVSKDDKFKANEIVYYKLIIKNPGNVTVATKTLTDTLPLRLRLLSVAGADISGYPQNGTDGNNDTWSVAKESDSRVRLDWTVSNLTAGETRELLIKAQVIPESEYKDICKETGNESTELESVKNEVFMDNEKKDEVTIDLDEIKLTGNITIKGVTSSTASVNTPMDVVFVLDTSGSMKYGLNDTTETEDSRAKAMVNAVNSSIRTIMSKNAESRIGVVGFSGDSSTIIQLGKYAQNTNYLKYTSETKENQGGHGGPGGPGGPGGHKEITQKIASNVTSDSERTVTGGTNTQSGIKAGAEMLINATGKEYTTKLNGQDIKVTRTPVLILVTDGEPTYYYANETATGDRSGDGGAYIKADENYYYWTIRTAKYYKDQITKTYYSNTEDNSKVFTIGIGMSGYEATALLKPDETNVKACDTNGGSYYRNQAGKLYDLLNKDGTPYAYDYANGTKSGSLTEKDIEDFLIKSIDQSQETSEVRKITTEESNSRIIKLNNLDDTKQFELTIGDEKYNSIDEAKNEGYLKGDATNGYYLDFTRVDISSNISVTYFQKNT